MGFSTHSHIFGPATVVVSVRRFVVGLAGALVILAGAAAAASASTRPLDLTVLPGGILAGIDTRPLTFPCSGTATTLGGPYGTVDLEFQYPDSSSLSVVVTRGLPITTYTVEFVAGPACQTSRVGTFTTSLLGYGTFSSGLSQIILPGSIYDVIEERVVLLPNAQPLGSLASEPFHCGTYSCS